MLRIGVVDTGIDWDQPTFKQGTRKGVGVRWREVGYAYDPDVQDRHGHGTAVARRIGSFCRNARVCAVRIAQQDGDRVLPKVPEQILAMGIDWCVDQGIRIVNVSYSIAEAPEDGPLDRVCRKAHENGVIVVAAYRNGEEAPVWPAAYPTVIGVRARNGLEPGQVSVLSEENYDLYAYGGSNSMATAQVSAMLGRMFAIDDSLNLDQVFAFLAEVAVA